MIQAKHLGTLTALAIAAVGSSAIAQSQATTTRHQPSREIITVQSTAISLEHADCEEVAYGLSRLFVTDGGSTKVTCYEPNNMLLVRALPSVIAEMNELVGKIDIASDAPQAGTTSNGVLTKLVPVEHASAGDLHRVLHDVFRKQARSGSVNFTVDERTNIIILSGSQQALDVITSLIKSLDVEVSAQSPEMKKTKA